MRPELRRTNVKIARVVTAMQAISDGAKRIDHIAGLIDELASQTSVLALNLNATFAAMRAGSAGREFAVVAREVPALAQRSTGAAADVKTVIAASAEQACSGDPQVRRTRVAMQRIVAAVTAVADNIDAIGYDSKAQSCEIAQLNQALSALDVRTRDSASLATRKWGGRTGPGPVGNVAAASRRPLPPPRRRGNARRYAFASHPRES